jgi:phosphoenolpyruvate carboxylase
VHWRRRRRQFHRAVGSGHQEGSIAAVFDHLCERGAIAEEVATVLGGLRVSPVLTAHPTEVRRKTVLDALGRIADLLYERGRLDAAAPERAGIEDSLGVEVLVLWTTAILRLSQLRRG